MKEKRSPATLQGVACGVQLIVQKEVVQRNPFNETHEVMVGHRRHPEGAQVGETEFVPAPPLRLEEREGGR